MLQGLVIAAAGAQLLKKTLKQEGLPFVEPPTRDAEGFRWAMLYLRAKPSDLLCLVETDREEAIASKLGMYCIGYLNPMLQEEQRLSGCRILLEGFQEIDRAFLENVHTRALGLPVLIAETNRLLIREMTVGDLDEINALYQEDPLALDGGLVALDRQAEEEKIRAYITYMYGLYQFGMWVITEKRSHRLIGRAGFGIADYLNFSEVDMGYLIGGAYRRQGYAEEACRAVLAYAKTVLDFSKVSAYIDQSNAASLHLIEKLGFHKEESFVWQERRMCRYLLTLR